MTIWYMVYMGVYEVIGRAFLISNNMLKPTVQPSEHPRSAQPPTTSPLSSSLTHLDHLYTLPYSTASSFFKTTHAAFILSLRLVV